MIATARNPAAPGLQGLRKEHPKALRIDRLDVTDEAAIKVLLVKACLAACADQDGRKLVCERAWLRSGSPRGLGE